LGENGRVDEAVQHYIDAIEPEYRPLFDRIHGLVVSAYPEADLALSYQMPTYKLGARRLYVGGWKHGISVYGWKGDRDGGFAARHPGLKTSKGTIQLRPRDAASLSDEELLDLIAAALGS
jgi:uncharacterized protein YdhG (YjbR/CyaY superfamily)